MKTEETVNQRVETLISTLKLNTNSFSKGMNMPATSIYNITGEKQSKPGYELIELICQTYNVNPTWLIKGEGNMFYSKDEVKPKVSEMEEELRSTMDFLRNQITTLNTEKSRLLDVIDRLTVNFLVGNSLEKSTESESNLNGSGTGTLKLVA